MQHTDDSLAPLERLIAVMAQLRGPGGCPWDREQTFATIAPYTLEEAHEVADAIARDAMDDLCEELGDLLLQVVFHAQIAADSGHFTLADVAGGIVAKMIRRHPHVFADEDATTAAEVRATWEEIKAAEKPRASALDGVALALPALTRAEKLGSRAARAGFDWPDPSGPRAKIDEELAELADARTPAAVTEEAGDLLFAVVNYLRHLGVDAEGALRAANAKFERRFRAIEAHPDFGALDLDGREALWRAAKRSEA